MNITKKPYEISLWEDELVWHRRKLDKVEISADDYEKGKYYSVNPNIGGTPQYWLDTREFDANVTYYSLAPVDEVNNLEGTKADIEVPTKSDYWRDAKGNLVPQIILQYYKEVKLCIIGSDAMESPARCVNPKLVRKVNGENTFTFTMYYRYWDDDEQDFVDNPFNRLMVNERKVKLRLGPVAENEADDNCQWFDFIIKSVQENSETKAFTYTCKDQFVNELSKSGFELVLDNELENNMGTIDVLANNVLKDSDWKLDRANTQNLKQYKEEPLYEIYVKDSTGLGEAVQLENPSSTMSIDGKRIFAFYSNIVDKKEEIQFLYSDKQDANGKIFFSTNDDLLIDKDYPNWVISGVTYDADGNPEFASDINISLNYRGARLVKQTQTKYDSTIDKYVGIYKKDGKDYYGFTQSEYASSGAIANYVANPSGFTSTSGWRTDANQLDYQISTKKEEDGLYKAYIGFTNKPDAWVMNEGIGGNRSSIGKFVEGEKYVLRMKYKIDSVGNKAYASTVPTAQICKYSFNEGKYVFEDVLFAFKNQFSPIATNSIDEDGNYIDSLEEYIYAIMECKSSVSETELADWDFRVGLFFNFGEAQKVYIEDVQVFPYETYTDDKERLCVPGGKLLSEIKTKYVYYEPDSEMKSIKDLKPVYEKYVNDETFVQQYNTNSSNIEGANEFTKVRSISAKESNRFNIIQSLCETFECWPKLSVKRNQITGQIYYGKDLGLGADEAYRQQKFISFREYAGKENYVGFRYGINSKSIQRTLDSASIVSKMIVKDNANEFAPNGSCSIARASENPTGENFLLNFDHYVRQDLLDFDTVTNDLYLDVGGYLGYYKILKRLNAQREPKIDEQSGLLKDIANYEASYTKYKTSYDSAVQQQLVIEKDFCKLAGVSFEHDDFASSVESLGTLSDELNKYWVKWCQYDNIIKQHGPLYEKADLNLQSAKAKYETIKQELKSLTEQKRALNLQFYKKYSRFIQEGSWIKEDYTDPNLYYLDSESTLHTSAQPKVTYNISVIDVAPLGAQEGYEDFAYYDFDVGDKTYIEDVEFFGWSMANRSAPYREEIVVTEIATELDAPEKNQIKVKNYKTQFEDLFQRITAQTQQAEYHTGEYNRAAAIVETNGTIAQSTLENSFANNSFKLSNARDQSVVWDESGITTTSLSNPSEMVRIISGGIFLSTDGGESWKTGVTGSGINTSYLTAGQINTNEIIIRSGDFASFRWDSIGLNAYGFSVDDKGNPHSFNSSKFVRFDQYGIYGVNNSNDSDGADFKPANEDAIWDNKTTKYALTWKGFLLRNNDGSVQIDSDNDIQVLQGNVKRIQIGRLKDNGITRYGIKIYDSNGNSVMETDDQGKLWLKDILYIGPFGENNYSVKIGNITEQNESVDKHQIINANTNFIVYADGSIKALNGTIANMTINSTETVIENGYFRILGTKTNENGEKEKINLFYYDSDANKLFVKGRIEANEGVFKGRVEASEGFFKGKVEASEGVFTGTINALEGTIGNIVLENNKLSAGDTENPSLVIDTNTGKITAEDIVLGGQAKIADQIQFNGSNGAVSYIYNPSLHQNKFISAGETTINADGLATFGQITISGSESKISGSHFEITPKYASFSNINCSGIIETAIFKKNLVQAASGALVFRPSYRIESIQATEISNEKILELNEQFDGDINTSFWLTKGSIEDYAFGIIYTEAKILSIEQESDNRKIRVQIRDNYNIAFEMAIDIGTKNYAETIDTKIDVNVNKDWYVLREGFFEKIIENNFDFNSESVYEIDQKHYVKADKENFNDSKTYYKRERDYINIYSQVDEPKNSDVDSYYEATGLLQPEFVMGINAGNASMGPANELLSRGLTIKEHGKKLPSLFLGDLSTANIGRMQGYGLYCDNVYLNGSLITTSATGMTAGVNTTSGIKGDIDKVGSTSPIIFWAGAEDTSEMAIQDAPFQVTEDGYVRATQAKFSDSVFAGGSIESASIRTAKIFGNGKEGSPALSVFGSSTGIAFYDQEEYVDDEGNKIIPNETFTINSTSFKKGDNNFIELSSGVVDFYGQFTGVLYSGIGQIIGDSSHMEIKINNSTKIDFYEENMELSGVIKYKEAASTMEYKPTEGGYNLYIV